MTTLRVPVLAAALLALSIPAAAAPLSGFVLAAETTHFAFYTRGNAKVEPARSEKFLEQVEAELGQTVTGRASYYRYLDATDVQSGTGQYAAGVTYPAQQTIHSDQSFHAHEIVHLVAGQMGDPGAFFQEGLAVALGNDGKWNGRALDSVLRARNVQVTSLSAAARQFASMDSDLSYPLAGSFVSWLIKTQGVKRVADFFRACPAPAGCDSAFAATFGQSLDAAGRAWTATL